MTDKRCELPGCNKKARIRFCCNRHKDRYHNRNNPRGRYAHLRNSDAPLSDRFDDYDGSWDEHYAPGALNND